MARSHKLTPAISAVHTVTVRGLERFLVLKWAAAMPTSGLDDARRRMSLYESFLAKDWDWGRKSVGDFPREEWDGEHELQLSRDNLIAARDLIALIIQGKAPGLEAIELLRLSDHLQVVLDGKHDGSSNASA